MHIVFEKFLNKLTYTKPELRLLSNQAEPYIRKLAGIG